MVAGYYCRSQIQRYPRARFAAPKEDTARKNNKRNYRIKIKKLQLQVKKNYY